MLIVVRDPITRKEFEGTDVEVLRKEVTSYTHTGLSTQNYYEVDKTAVQEEDAAAELVFYSTAALLFYVYPTVAPKEIPGILQDCKTLEDWLVEDIMPCAVSLSSMQEFGCPYCGYRSGYERISGGGTVIWSCGECNRTSVGLYNIKRSTIGVDGYYPRIRKHPREGVLSHGSADVRPENGGEYFRSRGLGLDNCTCFMCTDPNPPTLLNNIAAFVRCKESGERVVSMFERGARLDYREFEPDRVQVKIGACKAHSTNLYQLHKLCEDGVITKERIEASMAFKP